MGKKEDKKIAAKPVKKVESDSESSSEEEKPVVKAAPAKGKVVAKKQESSSEESSSEEEKPVVKKPVTKGKPAPPPQESSSESESEDEPPKPVAKAAPTKGKPAPKKESSSEEESSEEESEEEAPAPKKAAPAAKKAASESESVSESGSEEEEEEEEKPQKRKADTNAQDAKRKKGSTEEARIFVGGLPWSATDETLLEFVNSLDIGTFTEANVITERDTGRSKGFGYVTTTSDVAAALMKITDAEMDGRTLRFDNSDKKDAKPAARAAFGGGQTSAPATTLMVRNLSYNVDNDTLQQTFENATSCRVAMDRESGSSRGFGFVEFSSVDEAKAALESFNGTELDGRSISIDFAAPKPEGGRGGFGGGDRGGRGGFRGRGGFGGDRGGFRGGRGGDRGGRGGRGRGGFSDRGRGGFQGNKQKFDD